MDIGTPSAQSPVVSSERVSEAVSDRRDRPDFPPWPAGFVLRIAIFQMPLASWIGGLAAFAFYWGLPFIFAARDGTLITPDQLQTAITGMPGARDVHSFILRVVGKQTMETGLTYLTDRSHFAFSVLLALATVVGIIILRRLHIAAASIVREAVLYGDSERLGADYAFFRSIANHWAGRLASLLLAGVTLVLFLHFCDDPDHRYWWGSSSHGNAGYLFSGIEFLMVYYGTQGLLLIGVASILVGRFFSNGVKLRPFHPDGCNGLAPVGALIFLFWIASVLIAAAVFVAMYLGYLGLERTQLAWALAMLAIATVPLSAIFPLQAAVRAMLGARDEELRRLEPLLNEMYGETMSSARRGETEQSLSLAERLSKLREVHELLTDVNVWPFNPRALAAIMSVYAVQFLITVHEFVGNFPEKLLRQ